MHRAISTYTPFVISTLILREQLIRYTVPGSGTRQEGGSLSSLAHTSTTVKQPSASLISWLATKSSAEARNLQGTLVGEKRKALKPLRRDLRKEALWGGPSHQTYRSIHAKLWAWTTSLGLGLWGSFNTRYVSSSLETTIDM